MAGWLGVFGPLLFVSFYLDGAFPHKYFENLAHFSQGENMRPKHHVSPSIHHNLTIKTPHQNTQFLENPIENSPKTTKNRSRQHQDFFRQKQEV
jgi:hypothetical protein